jgi:hypothetical protein
MAQTRFTCTLTKADEPSCPSYARVTIMDSEGGSARACPRRGVAALDGIASLTWARPTPKGLNEWERRALELSEERSRVVTRTRAPRCQPSFATADDVPVACPIGRSTPGTDGHLRRAWYTGSRADGQADPLRIPTFQATGQPVSDWPLSSLAGPPLADSSLGLSGLRHLLRGIRLGDHVEGGIQHRLDYGAINGTRKLDDDPATVVR